MQIVHCQRCRVDLADILDQGAYRNRSEAAVAHLVDAPALQGHDHDCEDHHSLDQSGRDHHSHGNEQHCHEHGHEHSHEQQGCEHDGYDHSGHEQHGSDDACGHPAYTSKCAPSS